MGAVAADRGGITKKPTARCATCHRIFTINRDGTIRAHGARGSMLVWEWCRGTFEPPDDRS